MSDSLLRLAEELLRLEDSLLRLVDRLVDNPIIELSASLYFAYIQRVMSKLEDMADFFTYLVYITKNKLRLEFASRIILIAVMKRVMQII